MLKADIDRILSLGIEMKLNTPVGPKGESIEQLQNPYLESINIDGRTTIGKKVAVVGAVFSAMDAVRTSKRLGSQSLLVYRRQR